MATATPIRKPFAELSSQRLQQLSSIKNKQNALAATPCSNIKSPLSKVVPSLTPSTKKRAADSSPSSLFEADGENIDPAIFLSPSKKAKPSTAIRAIATMSARPSTPLSKPMATARTPATAPAGRSPPRPRPTRRISAPYTRIDPPAATSTAATGSSPFFSLSAALAGTRARSRAMPKTWFFAIHEDTPEQEAELLMEHSASNLDLSADEDAAKEQRGKENVAPEGTRVLPRLEVVRRKVVKAGEMDDGERSPLSEVEREDFFPEGVKADEAILVPGEDEAVQSTPQPVEVDNKSKHDDEIVIYEDSE